MKSCFAHGKHVKDDQTLGTLIIDYLEDRGIGDVETAKPGHLNDLEDETPESRIQKLTEELNALRQGRDYRQGGQRWNQQSGQQ